MEITYSYLLNIYVRSILFMNFIHLHLCDRVRFGLCESNQNSFRVFYGTTLNQCKEKCEERNICLRLNYHRPRQECTLYNEPNTVLGSDVSNCVIIYRNDINTSETECTCDDDRGTCQSDGTCEYKECPAVHIASDRGTSYGNVLGIGSKVKVTCHAAFHRVPDHDSGICSSSGQWEDLPACLNKCTGPCQVDPYSTLDVNGPSFEGEIRYFTCLPGFYSSENSSINKISVTCTPYGWFTGHSAHCRSDTVFPLNPDGIWYRGCQMYEFNYNDTTTQDQARERCQAYGDLIEIYEQFEQDYINEYLQNNGLTSRYWTQGKTIIDQYELKWVNDDDGVMTYFNWVPGQPDRNTEGSCLAVDGSANSQWTDEVCSYKYGYICKYTKGSF